MTRRKWITLGIIVLVIAAISAIAIPRYLEHRTRMRVRRVMEDQRSILGGDDLYHTEPTLYYDPTNGAVGPAK